MEFDYWARYGTRYEDRRVSMDPRAIGNSGRVALINKLLEEGCATGTIDPELFGDTVLHGVRL